VITNESIKVTTLLSYHWDWTQVVGSLHGLAKLYGMTQYEKLVSHCC